MRNTKFLLSLLALLLAFAHCTKSAHQEKRAEALNVDFRGMAVKDVQLALKGRWQLQRITGGIAGPAMEHTVTHHPYMVCSNDHLVLGNDSLGVFVDTPVTWAPATLFGWGYVMSGPNDHPALVPAAIRNDTLLVAEYANDGVLYHYTR